MPRRRFFVPGNCIKGGTAVLTPDQAHHLRDVLRLRAGDEVELFDGSGSSYSGKIRSCGSRVRIELVGRIDAPPEPGNSLTLATALVKSDRFELILQKGTELGVARFLPLETSHSTVRIPPAKLHSRLERWQRIVREASKQSRRATVPEIEPPRPFAHLLASQDYAEHARVFLYEKAHEGLDAASAIGGPVLLCIGPEGGWDESEAQAAGQAGFRIMTLGSMILRAETAAIAAVSIFQFLLQQNVTHPLTRPEPSH